MNRKVVFGVTMFFAVAGISIVDSQKPVSAGIGCRGCGGGGLLGGKMRSRCGGGGLFSGKHRSRCGGGGLLSRLGSKRCGGGGGGAADCGGGGGAADCGGGGGGDCGGRVGLFARLKAKRQARKCCGPAANSCPPACPAPAPECCPAPAAPACCPAPAPACCPAACPSPSPAGCVVTEGVPMDGGEIITEESGGHIEAPADADVPEAPADSTNASSLDGGLAYRATTFR